MQKKIMAQWNIQSSVSPKKFYKVTKYEDGSFACSCPAWIFQKERKERKDCHHIKKTKNTNLRNSKLPIKQELYIIPANVDRPIKKENKISVPLIPEIISPNVLATLISDIYELGASYSQIKEYFKHIINPSWSLKAVKEYVKVNGKVYLKK